VLQLWPDLCAKPKHTTVGRPDSNAAAARVLNTHLEGTRIS